MKQFCPPGFVALLQNAAETLFNNPWARVWVRTKLFFSAPYFTKDLKRALGNQQGNGKCKKTGAFKNLKMVYREFFSAKVIDLDLAFDTDLMS